MRRTPPLCRWQVAVPLLVALSLAGTVTGCALVQADVADRAESALAADGVEGVGVSASYRDVTLRGPADLRERALAAVSGLDAVRGATYRAVASAPPAVPPPLGARYDGRRMVLTGTVQGAAQRTALALAARVARPAVTTDNRVDVDNTVAAVAADHMRVFTAVVTALPAALRSGRVTLTDGGITITGIRRAAGLGALAAPLADARAAGLRVTDTTADGAGASGAEPAAVQGRLTDLLAGTTIRFDTASADITPASVALVDRVAAILRPALLANPVLSVRVEGHTDNQGNPDRNQNLSLRRARAVVEALVDRGVPRSRMTAAGFGESRPVADNGTAAGREQNRRIAFRVLGG